MEEAEVLCSRVAIIDNGKIIALGSPSELKASIPGSDIISLSIGNRITSYNVCYTKLLRKDRKGLCFKNIVKKWDIYNYKLKCYCQN